jgi:hypothetical protein
VALIGVILLSAIVAVGATFGLPTRLLAPNDSTRELSAPHDSTRASAYEQVLEAVRERAPNYWKNPSSGPGLLVSCADYRINELLNALCIKDSQMFQCRIPGAEMAPFQGKPNVGSATLDMFAGRAKVVVYIAHGDCKWNAAVRNRSGSKGTGHFAQAVDAAAGVAESDAEQGLRHTQSLLTNPTLSARIKSGEAEFVGLFLSTDGSVYVWEQKTNKYELVQAGAAKP